VYRLFILKTIYFAANFRIIMSDREQKICEEEQGLENPDTLIREHLATELFKELTNHHDLITAGFKFTFVKQPGKYSTWSYYRLPTKYTIITTPPDCGSFVTNNPFACEIINDRTWSQKEDNIVISISLAILCLDPESPKTTSSEYYDGSPIYMGTGYMGYETQTFKTCQEVIEQFEKILASKEITLASRSESKIMKTKLHEESGCCRSKGNGCSLFSRTGHRMSYFLEAYRQNPHQDNQWNKEKIIKVIKKALTGYSLTHELSDSFAFPVPLALIVREYLETYSDVLTIRFSNAIKTMIVLDDGNLALGFNNGVAGVYDIATKKIIFNKTHQNITSLCQFDQSTLVCGLLNVDKLKMWNFKDNTEKIINLPPSNDQRIKLYCKNNSIVLLEKNKLMINLSNHNVYIIDFSYKKTKIIQVDFNTECFFRDNYLIFMGYKNDMDNNVDNNMDPDTTIASVFNAKDFIEANLNGECINTFTLKWDIKQFERISKNKFLCLISYYHGHFSKIYILNIKTNTNTIFINENKSYIKSIAYLGNNHLALLRNNRIQIIDIKTKIMVHQINTDNNFTSMIKINGMNNPCKLFVVESIVSSELGKIKIKSCVRIFQNLGG
jgi:hypothetical protein